MAAAMMTAPTRDSVGKGIAAIVVTIAIPAMMPATIGVRKPMSKQPPTMTASAAMNDLSRLESPDGK